MTPGDSHPLAWGSELTSMPLRTCREAIQDLNAHKKNRTFDDLRRVLEDAERSVGPWRNAATMTEARATKGYRIELYQDPVDDSWAADVPDLPGCVAAGASPADAITAVVDAIDAWIDTATSLGRAVPPPSRRAEEHSGRFVLRVPRGLHGRPAREAEREGVSLNSYCATVLAEAVGASSGAGMPRPFAIARVSSETG